MLLSVSFLPPSVWRHENLFKSGIRNWLAAASSRYSQLRRPPLSLARAHRHLLPASLLPLKRFADGAGASSTIETPPHNTRSSRAPATSRGSWNAPSTRKLSLLSLVRSLAPSRAGFNVVIWTFLQTDTRRLDGWSQVNCKFPTISPPHTHSANSVLISQSPIYDWRARKSGIQPEFFANGLSLSSLLPLFLEPDWDTMKAPHWFPSLECTRRAGQVLPPSGWLLISLTTLDQSSNKRRGL